MQPVVDNTIVQPPYPIIDSSKQLEQIFHFVAQTYPAVFSVLKSILNLLVAISIPFSLFCIIVIIYCVEKLKKIRKAEEKIYDLKVEPAFEKVDTGDPALTNRWLSVSKHVASPNQNDWKQAILEADIMLDDILTKMGYQGESVGEKLKRANPGDFKSLHEAWEAHKVRNQIAHEGSDFTLGEHDAKHVISMYKKVFEEFFYI
jgi:hypothetical protein